ncbi:MAG: OsmC family protein [Gemmatimonadota bacterium]|nr:OsmC family protein [Gemmatimonadota bacterium]
MSEGVPSPYDIEVVWEGGMRYRGGPAGGPTLVVDGDREAAPSPVDALVVALASCSAIDVVEILRKRRTSPTALRVRVEFSRASDPPRRLTEARLHFTVETASDRSHVERAVALSFEKYCSVANSLRPEIRLFSEVVLEPSGDAAAAAGSGG